MKTMLFAILFATTAAVPKPENPHPPPHLDTCMSCHAPEDEPLLEPRVTRPCAPMCLSCHTKLEGHHPVGVKIDKRISAPLLLTAEGKNTCSTCHDLTIPRTASRPWTSQPLIRWIARRPIEHPTYHLVIRNNRGQLCRNCH
jgi:hypothetical protein